MKQTIKYLIKSILAGIMIGIGGTVFLSLENKVAGATFFAIGLFIIVIYQLNLYTGKIGYIFENNLKYAYETLVTIVGNFIGTFFVGFILKFTRIYANISEKAQGMCATKLDDSITSILILSFFCGILMYLAVNGYKTMKDPIGKYAGVFLGVIVFILCGFEHSIANMYYFSVAEAWSLKAFGYELLMIFGNALGGILFPLCNMAKKWLTPETQQKSN